MSQSSVTEKQNTILDAAQVRFAHFGVQKVTMDEIASDLGMSKAALYYYFTTKEEIFRQVIIREQQQFSERVVMLVELETSATGKLKTYLLHFLDLFNELVNLKFVSSDNLQGLKPVLRDFFKQLAEKEYLFIRNIISQGNKNGEFALESVEQTVHLIVHILQGLRMRYYKIQVGPEDIRQQLDINGETQLLAHVILNGIQKRTDKI
jgi:TetR/AcrR family transcriptional repressor of mexJK operon